MRRLIANSTFDASGDRAFPTPREDIDIRFISAGHRRGRHDYKMISPERYQSVEKSPLISRAELARWRRVRPSPAFDGVRYLPYRCYRWSMPPRHARDIHRRSGEISEPSRENTAGEAYTRGVLLPPMPMILPYRLTFHDAPSFEMKGQNNSRH